ncbi:multidrug efflux RND transporter permease subunit [Siccirubricoccus sp. KC 17139]|uniref:Efflux pump membrane transporter n=1 Tax=Siccirubricoccus soli TaxID=2899147 RepID=A0ABT1D253_9PROT|nr:multidrug efflux RND transporter permease subunit [Siccirubricoccus soli]MCO6415998.1 multidrug efflux RND transporter permease subunit [Siccirubricoccus soli]MCP2682130.1 multidrug efflux RND transporter permease subunit [Siccirubricoccus soli]
MSNLGVLSVRQPVLACVLSLVLLIVGGLSLLSLPISEYPDVAPPTVVVATSYPGASAQVVADTVATPIEQEVNGTEGMLYMSSQSTADGRMVLTVTFRLGTDPDRAQILVQGAVSTALPRLPEEVRRWGVTTRKLATDRLMIVFVSSPDGSYDQLYVSNYALRQVRDELLRIDGIGDIDMQGARDYAMRVWLDPGLMAANNITAEDIVAAVQAQNAEVAGGQIAEPPVTDQAFQPNLTFRGRLADPLDFERIVIRAGADGRLLRLGDVGRVELGAASYTTASTLQGRPAVALAITQRPGSNALATATEIRERLAEIARDFPAGITAEIAYDPTRFVADSVHELVRTIGEAVGLVVLVVLLFLQNWRAATIPILAIPVSLIGTFGVMIALGFTLNVLTLFGLVLAVGIVVDDAIVVVENVDRHLKTDPTVEQAATRTMREVGGALISIALLLCAVFVPTAFLEGITGRFFRQFAVTIAVATALSCFCSLTLSPALATLILHREEEGPPRRPPGALRRAVGWALDCFNAGFDRLAEGYGALTRRVAPQAGPMLLLYAMLIAGVSWLLLTSPQGFVPAQDRGYAIVSIELPGGSSLMRTTAVVEEAVEIAREVPGVARVAGLAGVSGATNTAGSNQGQLTVVFTPFEARREREQSAASILAALRRRLAGLQEATVLVIPPPAVPGLGSGVGFALRLEDRTGRGTAVLADAAQQLVTTLNRTPGLTGVYTPFRIDSPLIAVDIDRTRTEMLGVPVARLSQAIETLLGSSYVNDFTAYGRNWRVVAQGAPEFRREATDLARLYTRNAEGAMVPLANVMSMRDITGPQRVPRYNLYPAAEVAGEIRPGTGSAAALRLVERTARRVLPDGIGFEWTDLSYEQRTSGNAGLLVFPLCVLFVYLVLAAQYGSWSLPFAVILIVPMCLLTSTLGVRFLGQDVNILTQIGFVVLVGLAAKNAILIVEFAQAQEDTGKSPLDAVVEACRLRLRAILMTSLAFILGVLPLVLAEGAGAEMRRAVGAAVFFGMIGVTLFGLLFTPVFYLAIRRITGPRRSKLYMMKRRNA